MGKLAGKNSAIIGHLIDEQCRNDQTARALEEAGAETKIVSPKLGQIQGMHHADKGDKFDVYVSLDEARVGGIRCADDSRRSNEPGSTCVPHLKLWSSPDISSKEHKPVAAICHGPWC